LGVPQNGEKPVEQAGKSGDNPDNQDSWITEQNEMQGIHCYNLLL